MAGLPWIPLDAGFPTGPHAIALAVALQKPHAGWYVVRLWAWAAEHQADGIFEGPAAVSILEQAAGWDGAAGELVDAMCLPHIQLLDHTSSGFYIHNWHLHCGAHIEKREKDRARHRAKASKESPRKLRGGKTEPPRRNLGASPSPSLSPSQCESRSLASDGSSTEMVPTDAAPSPAVPLNGKGPALDAEAQALLRLLPAKAVDVATSLGLPRGAVDSALEELRGRGLVRLSSGMVPQWERA